MTQPLLLASKTSSCSFRSSEQGFSLVELLVGVGILALIVSTILTFMSYTAQQQRSLRSLQAFNDQVSFFQMGIDDVKACTYNLGTVGSLEGFTVPAVGEEIPVDLHYYDPANPTQAREAAKPLTKTLDGKQLDSTLNVRSTTLMTMARIGPEHYIGRIVVRAEKTGLTFGGAEITQGFPIYIVTNNTGKILYCYGNYASGGLADLQQKQCEVLVGPDYYWDPKTNKCETRFETKCYPGTREQASCDPASFGLSREICRASGVVDPLANTVVAPRTYGSGAVRTTSVPDPVSCLSIDNMTAKCDYAADADSSAAICMACCNVEKASVQQASQNAAQ